ncbi:MAG: hypothetical protein GX289_11125 [Tissierellia bacterium]|jgi:hypothetical protein|nr:hypothetical protein [Tissierellia bacterium]
MQYKGTLIAISDMEESKKFYQDLLGMHVIGDFGANVQLENGLFLQTKDTWENIIANKEIKPDPDHHMIEVAEDMVMVMKRFADSGMSVEEVAVRMDVPVNYIKEHLDNI